MYRLSVNYTLNLSNNESKLQLHATLRKCVCDIIPMFSSQTQLNVLNKYTF